MKRRDLLGFATPRSAMSVNECDTSSRLTAAYGSVNRNETMKSHQHKHHKHAQLCAQVARIIGLTLGESTDSRLHRLLVHSVSSNANGARLTVHVVLADAVDFQTLEETLLALEGAKAWLREQVAEEIHRKRCPDLGFELFLAEPEPGER